MQTYNGVILDAVGLTPSAHDERVVVGNDSDDIDTLGLEGLTVGNVTWKVGGGAGWGESSWEGEEDNFLVGPLCSSTYQHVFMAN